MRRACLASLPFLCSCLFVTAQAQGSVDSVDVWIELVLNGTNPLLLDTSNLNGTRLVERLNEIAVANPLEYGRLANALQRFLPESLEANEVVVSACGVGSYINAANGICTPCPAGTYSETALSISVVNCLLCPAGTYSAAVGAANRSTCLACPSGSFSAVLGATEVSVCLTCGPGATSIVGAQGQSQCQCVAGFYKDGDSCKPCEQGYFCSGDAKQACPGFAELKSTSDFQSSAIEHCKCRPGFYGFDYVGSGCLPCTQNFYCTGEQGPNNEGRISSCPANSQSPAGSDSVEDCTCMSSYRRQYSMPAVRSLVLAPGPCNCTNAGAVPVCRSIDVSGCTSCSLLVNCDPAVTPVFTCKQGVMEMLGTISAGTRTWRISPAGAKRVRVTFGKFQASTAQNQMRVVACSTAACTLNTTLGTLSGDPAIPQTFVTLPGFTTMVLIWTSTSTVSSPVLLEYTSEIVCNENEIAVNSGQVQFLNGDIVSYPFQPEQSWPLVVWLGDTVIFTPGVVKVDLRAGTAAGQSLVDPVNGIGTWAPNSTGSYWLVDVEFSTRTRQIVVVPVDSRNVLVWYSVSSGVGKATFALTGDVVGAGSPDVVLVVNDVLTMGRLSSAHGVVIMSRYASPTDWTALGGSGVAGQSVNGTGSFEPSVTWDTKGYNPGVYYYGSVSSMATVTVGRIVLHPLSGGATCAECLAGEYCFQGGVVKCPPNSVSNPGSTSVSDCRCAAGFAVSNDDLEGYGNAQTVDTGGRHTCVVAQNSSLWCWGANDKGQLGLGFTSEYEATPRMVPGLSGVRNLSLGDDFTCAVVGANVRVRCWGANDWGQLGLDSMTQQNSPAGEARLGRLTNPYTTLALACAAQSCCAIVSRGTPAAAVLTCWGKGDKGQLAQGGNGGFSLRNVGTGDTNTISTKYSYDITGAAISLGAHVAVSLTMAAQHACALTQLGGVLCWGTNENGALGIGSASAGVFNPTEVNVGGQAKAVNCYALVCCVVMRVTYVVKCWGKGAGGRLGVGLFDVGSTAQSMGANLPSVNLGKNSLVMDVNVGDTQTCVLLLNNHVRCWGLVSGVVLGDDPPSDMMDMLPNFNLAGTSVALQVNGKGPTVCAVTSAYAVVCWGDNTFRQVGGAVSVPSTGMALAALPTGVTALRQSGTPTSLTCMVCAENTYCTGQGGLPESCPANTRSPVMSTASSECVCFAGYKKMGGDASAGCELCTGAEYCVVGVAYQCPPNSATVADGSSSASACQCARGHYYAGVDVGCAACQFGRFKQNVGNDVTCQLCPAGTANPVLGLGNASGCETCEAGTFSLAGAQSCTECDDGSAAVAGSTACRLCGAGFFSGRRAGACSPCPAGTYDDEPRDGRPGTCSPCTGGKFSSVLNATADVCRDCAAGTFSASAAGECTPCPPGEYSLSGAVACLPCPANSTSAGGLNYTQCKCLAGFTKRFALGETTIFSCERCGAGRFSLYDNVGDCVRCPAGSASGALGAETNATCVRCTRGNFAAIGSASCSPCPGSTFSGSDGASSCTDCLLGYYAASGSSACVPCAQTRYAVGPITGPEGCLVCPAGSYCVGAFLAYRDGVPLEQRCPMGTFQNDTGRGDRSQCQPCGVDFFCPSPTMRARCPVGTTSNATSTSQLQCVCKQGFTCNYKKVVNAVVTLYMSASEFNENPGVQQAFLQAVALAARTSVQNVRITRIQAVSGGGRRLLQARTRGLHVGLEIEGGDGSGSGLGAELDELLNAAGFRVGRERMWIAPHEVTALPLY